MAEERKDSFTVGRARTVDDIKVTGALVDGNFPDKKGDENIDPDDATRQMPIDVDNDGDPRISVGRKALALQEKTSIQAGTKRHYSGAMSVVNDFSKKAQEAFSRRMSEIKAGLESRINRIRDLHQQKYKVMRSAYTRNELMDLAIKGLAEEKKRNNMAWLTKHLEDCRQHKAQIFNGASLRALFSERDIPKLFLHLTTDDDIKAAIATLPNDGVSQKEREKQLKQIDDEIQNLSRELEAEMAKTEGDLNI